MGAIAAPIGGRLSDRYGRRLPVVAGSVCLTAGLVALWWFAAGSTAAVIGLLLGVVGLGLGLSGSPRQAAALDAIPGERVGMAAGTYYTGRYLGGVARREPGRGGARGDRDGRRASRSGSACSRSSAWRSSPCRSASRIGRAGRLSA